VAKNLLERRYVEGDHGPAAAGDVAMFRRAIALYDQGQFDRAWLYAVEALNGRFLRSWIAVSEWVVAGRYIAG
jgi:hypothetical protein